jgi:GTP pyrophosphokinase
VALGGAKISAKVVTNKILQRLTRGESAVEARGPAAQLLDQRKEVPKPTGSSSNYGIKVEGIDDVMLRLAKCCRPVPGDPIVGYVSLGRGITIHREDCPNVEVLRKDPDRFTPVSWDGESLTSFKVELHIDGWDRHRLLEDLSRTFSEAGINIVEARCTSNPPMIRNRFVVEVADTKTLDATINRLRAIESVFDAYRVTPGAGA